MPWDTKDRIARRLEFVQLSARAGCSFTALCRRFSISRRVGYKWVRRYQLYVVAGLCDQRPAARRRPNQTPHSIEQLVLGVREAHPTWGPRKIRRRLLNLGHPTALLPALSSIAALLKREGYIDSAHSKHRRPLQRFERAEPNELWQMDFKGHFAMHTTQRCHPLTVLDDCSRFLIGLQACSNEQTATVQHCLHEAFSIHGLPQEILCDNGSCWGKLPAEHTQLTVWLLRLGVRVIHGRPFHPQTQGKDERFHRTLKADLLARHDWPDLLATQRRFDDYRRLYNYERPHQAIGMEVPAERYRTSARGMPSQVSSPEYDTGEIVRRVKSKGEITFRNRFIYVGRAFYREWIALRPLAEPGQWRVCFGAIEIGRIDVSASTDIPKGNYHRMMAPRLRKLLPPCPNTCYP